MKHRKDKVSFSHKAMWLVHGRGAKPFAEGHFLNNVIDWVRVILVVISMIGFLWVIML